MVLNSFISQWFENLALGVSSHYSLNAMTYMSKGEDACGCVSDLKVRLLGQRVPFTGQLWRPRGGSPKPGKPGQLHADIFHSYYPTSISVSTEPLCRWKETFLFLDFVILCLKIPNSFHITRVKIDLQSCHHLYILYSPGKRKPWYQWCFA